MPDIIACFKWVVDEAYLRADSGGKLDLEWAEYKLSDYDRNAVEEAMRIYEEYGGSVVALTVGTPDATKGIKDVLARGPEKAYFINDDFFADLEPSQTAAIIGEFVREQLQFDLIICGEGSSDLYAQQVGSRLAERLGIPCLTFVQKIILEGEKLVVERKTDDGVELLSVKMPALITVAPDINRPRVPGLRDTLAASKKPVVYINKENIKGDYPPLLKTDKIYAAKMERNCVSYGQDIQDIASFADALWKAGVLKKG